MTEPISAKSIGYNSKVFLRLSLLLSVAVLILSVCGLISTAQRTDLVFQSSNYTNLSWLTQLFSWAGFLISILAGAISGDEPKSRRGQIGMLLAAGLAGSFAIIGGLLWAWWFLTVVFSRG